MSDDKEVPAGVKEVTSIVPQALEGKSEADVTRLGEIAQKLLKKNPRIAKAFYSMAASVRLYNTAVAAISDECLAAKLGEDSAGIVYILVNSVRKITAEPFERRVLSATIQQHVLEFMAMELSLEEEEESRINQEDDRAAAAARREKPIVLGYPLVTQDNLEMGRDRTLLLVGPCEQLKQLTEFITTMANLNKQTVVRLASQLTSNTDIGRKANSNLWRVELGGQFWINCAATKRKTYELLNRVAHRLRGNRLDLLIVDDLLHARDSSVSDTTPKQYVAAQAQRIFRDYGDSAGAAVICCWPTDTPCVYSKSWDKLEVYTDLRFVTKGDDEKIRVEHRDGEPWLAIPETREDLLDEEHSAGIQMQGESDSSTGPTAADAPEVDKEARDD